MADSGGPIGSAGPSPSAGPAEAMGSREVVQATGQVGTHSTPAQGPCSERPLLIVCALSIEKLALRGRANGRADVLRTGMGPANARRAVHDALSAPALRDTAVIASGFCAGLAPGMLPGDLVVATATRTGADSGDSATICTEVRSLADAVGRAVPGRAVHTGVLIGSDHVVRGPERAALHTGGAIAVDMESAVTLRTALTIGTRPVAAVRVVVDAPEHELVRLGTVRGGISAFRVLRAVLPAFHEWHRSLLLPWR